MAVSTPTTTSAVNTTGLLTIVTVTGVTIPVGGFALIKTMCRILAGESAQTPTFNGSTAGMVAIPNATIIVGTSAAEMKTWYLLGQSGTGVAVVVDFGVAGSTILAVAVEVYTGTDTTTPIGTVVFSSGTSNASSDTASNYVDGRCSDIHVQRNDDVMTAGSGQLDSTRVGSGFGTEMWLSHKDGAASVTMGWSGDVSGDGWGHAVIPINPPLLPPTPANMRPVQLRPAVFRPGRPR